MKTQKQKRGYYQPKVKKVKLDRDISIQMTSPPSDPFSTKDSGNTSPF